ncbi:MAG: cation transporter, partial [Arcobacter sp.]|nr:cation transporter [Arcobacter sp.]
MENCKFGLNDHKPFFKEESHHHHHDEENCSHHHEHEHGHSHDHRGTDKKVLKWALSITLITMFLEFFY